MKKWYRRWLWKISRWWYRTKLWFGWWYCERCEKMHSPLQEKYEFDESGVVECHLGVYDLPVPKSYESDPEYFYDLAKDMHRVG